MKQTKREFLPLYSYYDRTGISAHLEAMAAKGWLLEKLTPWGWLYRRTEPRQLRFSVTYFPKASQFDPMPSEDLQTYRAFCAEAGWVLAADNAQLQVFYHEDPSATPIETDSETEFLNINTALKGNVLRSQWFLFAISLFQVVFSLWRIWQNPVQQLSNTMFLWSNLSWIPLLLLSGIELIHYYRWQSRARHEIAAGGAMSELRTHRKLSIFILLLISAEVLLMFASAVATSRKTTVILLGSFAIVGIIMFLVQGAIKLMKRLRFSAGVSRILFFAITIALTIAITIAFASLILRIDRGGWLDSDGAVERYEYKGMTWARYEDSIPLRIEDLVPTEYTTWSTRLTSESSPLLTYLEATQRPKMDALEEPELSYKIVMVKADFLHPICKDYYIRWLERHNEDVPGAYREEYLRVDMPEWNTAEVYQRVSSGESCNQFLVCWPDRIVEINFDWDWTITPELVTAAAEKLRSFQPAQF